MNNIALVPVLSLAFRKELPMIRFKTKACCLWFALWMFNLQAASVDDVRGALLFNLSKVISFPAPKSGTVNLCVFPESRGIIQFFKQKGALQSQGKPFHLKVLENNQQPTAGVCQMLYVEWPFAENNNKQLLLDWSNNIMTISNDPEFLLSGGLMSLTTADNRMVIMMNKDSLKQSAVIFPSRVLKLATWYP
jgi:hypothetical protein